MHLGQVWALFLEAPSPEGWYLAEWLGQVLPIKLPRLVLDLGSVVLAAWVVLVALVASEYLQVPRCPR